MDEPKDRGRRAEGKKEGREKGEEEVEWLRRARGDESADGAGATRG